ncbi:MAG: lipoprotein signal peptidase [Bacteroidales bacterium]|nr:lipoprotein signal peptidase [Bacteroidales bacterium]MCF8386937.1 lipoprotein signal peptidase [Bacteroidales bacterium]MCF8397448.1 lipoprotein signal peptidase [Bacteroidales bacterium]
MKKAIIIILSILVADQILKYWIKTTMTIGEEIPVFGNWFIIHFTENNGMAFGIQFAGEFGKLALSIFRIIAVIAIGWYLIRLTKEKAKPGLIVSLSLIFAGALGNIIDSAFYGLLFSQSSYHSVAEFMPEGGGYATFLHGKVVDMFYFPIIQGTVPTWFPFWAGEPFIFFRPVFNIADSAITIGVVLLIIFQKSFFKKEEAGS